MNLPKLSLETVLAPYENIKLTNGACSHAEPMTLKALLNSADDSWLEKWQECQLSYPPITGSEELRTAIAKASYESVNASSIMTTAGAEEAIYIICQQIISPGDRVVAITPSYESLQKLPVALGANLITQELTWGGDGFDCDFQQLIEKITPQTKLVIINFPHNPTGLLPSADEFAQLIERVAATGAYLLSDEVYRGTEYDVTSKLPAAVDCYERAISIGVCSKALSLPGIRVGWLATQDKTIIESSISIKRYLSICNDKTADILATLAINHSESILKANRNFAKANLSTLIEQLECSETLTCYKPKAGYVMYPSLLEGVDTVQFIDYCARQHGLIFYPAAAFSHHGSFIRIGYATTALPLIIQTIKAYERAMNN